MAYRFLGVKLLPGTLERFLGMPKIKVAPETPYRGLLVRFTHSTIRSCTKRAVPKIGNVQRTLSGIGSRSTYDADDRVLHERLAESIRRAV
jgi:hypothetical protein